MRRGFTLVELLVVLAVLAVSVSVIPAAMPFTKREQPSEALELLVLLLDSLNVEASRCGCEVLLISTGDSLHVWRDGARRSAVSHEVKGSMPAPARIVWLPDGRAFGRLPVSIDGETRTILVDSWSGSAYVR